MKQYDLYLRDRIIELDVAIKELASRNDISIRAKISMLVKDIMAGMEKLIEVHPNLILDSSCGDVAKTVYEHFKNISTLDSEVSSTISAKVLGRIENKMRLEEKNITMLHEWLYSCSSLYNFLRSSDVDTLETSYCCGEAISSLLTEMGEPPVSVKMIYSARDTMELIHQAGCRIEYLLSAEQNKLTMSGTANAMLARYRTLGDMDADAESGADLTLGDFDTMSLEDIDFVIIE